MKVQLMMTCLCDAFFPDVAKATVQVLEHFGCEVVVPENQTCCGQPAFNSGEWPLSRKVVRHCCRVFNEDIPIVTPSSSCAAMLQHGAPLEFEKESDRSSIESVGHRSYEICDFLVNQLGVKKLDGKLDKSIVLHAACHSRGTSTKESALKLLSSISGLRILSFGEEEQCCGFGGTFAVTFPHISKDLGQTKISNLLADKPDIVASTDMSCLMHLKGLAEKQGQAVNALHVVQILNDSLGL